MKWCDEVEQPTWRDCIAFPSVLLGLFALTTSTENGMRIVVTGATGVIGKRIIPHLRDAGHTVTAIIRDGSPHGSSLSEDCKTVVASLFDVDQLAKVFSGQDAVVNLAMRIPQSSLSMVTPWAWRENDRIRSAGARNVSEAASRAGVSTLVQESFAFAYPSSGDSWIDETLRLEPAANCRTVLDAEEATQRFAQRGGRGVALRFAGFYGPDANQTRTMAVSVKRGWAALPGRRNDYISSVSHDDAATAVVSALNAPSGAYNVTDDFPLTRQQFFDVFAETLHVPSPRFLPHWTGFLMGAVGRSLSRSTRLSNRKLQEATGWVPASRSATEGLPSAIAVAMKC